MDPGSVHARLVAASVWSALVAGVLYTPVTGAAVASCWLATVQYLKTLVANEAVDREPHHRLPSGGRRPLSADQQPATCESPEPGLEHLMRPVP